MSSIACGGDAGDDMRDQRVEDLGGAAPGGAHAGKALRPMQLDRAVAADHVGFEIENLGVHVEEYSAHDL